MAWVVKLGSSFERVVDAGASDILGAMAELDTSSAWLVALFYTKVATGPKRMRSVRSSMAYAGGIDGGHISES